jgi:hypothetical protein
MMVVIFPNEKHEFGGEIRLSPSPEAKRHTPHPSWARDSYAGFTEE